MKFKNGFTLLELLISLTILSIIVVMIFGALRIGVRAWEKGEKDTEIHQRYRIVLNLVSHQVSSICLNDIKNNASGKFFSFKGDGKSLEFLSYIPLNPENKYGIVYVKYFVEPAECKSLPCEEEKEKARLSFYEKNVVLFDKETDTEKLTEDDFYALIPQAYEIRFEYLKGMTEEKDFDWQESWDPEKDEGFPLAIKIVLKKDKDSAPIAVISQIDQNIGI